MAEPRRLRSISELRPGDSVQGASGTGYMVTDVSRDRAIGVRTVEIYHPEEWLHFPAAPAVAQEEREEAGECTACGLPVYLRPDRPGEYDHDCPPCACGHEADDHELDRIGRTRVACALDCECMRYQPAAPPPIQTPAAAGVRSGEERRENVAETVRVRVGVVVMPDGRYNAIGWLEEVRRPPDDAVLRDAALDTLASMLEREEAFEHYGFHFVEADIPLPRRPEPVTVEGEVKDAG